MATKKYDIYIINPPHIQMRLKSDNSVIFDGLMANRQVLNYDFTVGHQFVRKPFKGDNPAHTHNFQEFLAWYGGNPDDPSDFGAEVVLYMGEEMVKYVFTHPTIVSLPPGLVHCPLEITRVDRPIIQLEMMLPTPDGSPPTREPFFAKDKGFTPQLTMNITDLSGKK
jgi:hypothetical protein